MSRSRQANSGPNLLDLSIIIVNWNSAAYLRQCLRTIYADSAGLAFEVVVVDNASYDGCAAMLASEFPGVKFVQNDQNAGFAAANNLGSQYAGGDCLLFLNPDTEIVGSALSAMLSCMRSFPDAGILGCRLLNTDGSLQTSCVQPIPTILNQALDAELLRCRFPRLKLWGMEALTGKGGCPAAVEAVSGACLLIRRSVFEEVGLFTTDYFMYMEDLDLCDKVRKAGHKVYYTDSATVVHHGGQSTSQKNGGAFGSLMTRESIRKFLAKNRGPAYASLYTASTAVAATARLALLAGTLALPIPAQTRADARSAFEKWKRILRWTLGLEPWTSRLGPTAPATPPPPMAVANAGRTGGNVEAHRQI